MPSLIFVLGYFEKVLSDKKASTDLKEEIRSLVPKVSGGFKYLYIMNHHIFQN